MAHYEEEAAARERAEGQFQTLDHQREQLAARGDELESRLAEALLRADEAARLEQELSTAWVEVESLQAQTEQRTSEIGE